tara:strand:+ start:367 stop:1041 length:675 start_codon:yes stop_codon:yes gene_type:complete
MMSETVMTNHLVAHHYSVCVIDIGSPKLGNLGWYLWDATRQRVASGDDLDALFEPLIQASDQSGVLLGLEAPLFVPIRQDLLLMTKARAGESPRPWSAGAGAQVLAMNLPIMTYLFQQLQIRQANLSYCIESTDFTAKPGQVLLFEALVSGANKGSSHIDDAKIMVDYCRSYSDQSQLPPTILQHEAGTTFLNLAACALLHLGLIETQALSGCSSPIYRPDYRP